jgi:hypothetical protein
MKKVDSMQMAKVKKGKNKHSDILKSTAALFALGKSDFADIEPLRNDEFFRDSLQLNQVASEATLRQRLDILASTQEVLKFVLKDNIEMLKRVDCFGAEKTEYGEYIPLDIDVSPLDGKIESLIAPRADTDVMDIFLKQVSERFPDEFILMVMDEAAWHTAKNYMSRKT